MQKISFKNDYSRGAHPALLAALTQYNTGLQAGYGLDQYSLAAADKIRELCQKPDLSVHFVCGGTQANLLAIAAALRPFESVISAETGHIQVHETGAIEATGHKIEVVPTPQGKLHPDLIAPVLERSKDEHSTLPRMVYISNTTELGTLYSLQELRQLSAFCRENGLFLYMDGARLGAALTAPENDVDFPALAALCDAFTIGGTKNGALLGEAMVIRSAELAKHFRYHMKQRGALLAKGSLLGIQFLTLLDDGLFFELARQANQMAGALATGILEAGFNLQFPARSNQLFPILPLRVIRRLQEHFDFYIWEQLDEEYAVLRLVCCWASQPAEVEAFLKKLKQASPKTEEETEQDEQRT